MVALIVSAIAAVSALSSPQVALGQQPAQEAPYVQYTTTTRVTHYWSTGNPMASGYYPFVGAVACSYDLPLYTKVRTSDGSIWQCLDRGNLYGSTWLDFYGFLAEEYYGSWTIIEILTE